MVENQTFPGWRDFERAVAAVLGGTAPETKGVFDVIVASTERPDVDYGLSIKSKALKGRAGVRGLAEHGRVYIELSNSPAKFLSALGRIGFFEADFLAGTRSQAVGEVILQTVTGWHHECASEHLREFGRRLDLSQSRYLVLSYSLPTMRAPSHAYQWHSFSMEFPERVIWKYASKRCLRGYDPESPSEALFDFYLLSGGQLKYYPKASRAVFSSNVFELENVERVSYLSRAARMFPVAWKAAGGASALGSADVVRELDWMVALSEDQRLKAVLISALDQVRRLGKKGQLGG